MRRIIDKAFTRPQNQTFQYFMYSEVHYDLTKPLDILPIFNKHGRPIHEYITKYMGPHSKNKFRFTPPSVIEHDVKQIPIYYEFLVSIARDKETGKQTTVHLPTNRLTEISSSIIGYNQADFGRLVHEFHTPMLGNSNGTVVLIPNSVDIDFKSIAGQDRMLSSEIHLQLPLHIDMFNTMKEPYVKKDENDETQHLRNREHITPYILFITPPNSDRIVMIFYMYKKDKWATNEFPYETTILYDNNVLDIKKMHLKLSQAQKRQTVISPTYKVRINDANEYVTFDTDSTTEKFQAVTLKNRSQISGIEESFILTHKIKDPISVTCGHDIRDIIIKEYDAVHREMTAKLLQDIDALEEITIKHRVLDDFAQAKIQDQHKKQMGTTMMFAMISFDIIISCKFITKEEKGKKADVQYILKVYEIMAKIVERLQTTIQRVTDKLKERAVAEQQKDAKGKIYDGKMRIVKDDGTKKQNPIMRMMLPNTEDIPSVNIPSVFSGDAPPTGVVTTSTSFTHTGDEDND